MKTAIQLSVPNLVGNEMKFANEAMASRWVSTGGEFIGKFEKNIKDYVQVEYASACISGTAGLHLAIKILGIDKDDEVLVPCLTFIATVNPVRYMGAYPVFMDCDDSLCIDPVKLREFCRDQCIFDGDILINKTTHRVVKAIIVVHIFGNLANMDEIMAICHEYNLMVIEDATESLGSFYNKGKFKGRFSGTIGNVGVYSFNGNKIITTGGGGMVVSRDNDLISKVKYFSYQAKDDPIFYIHNDIGYNYGMTNIQAAIGVAQMENIDIFIETKKKNYFLYKRELENIPGLCLLDFANFASPNYWFYSLYVDEKTYGMGRNELFIKLKENNIQTRPIWGLINKQKPYLDFQKYKIEKAMDYFEHILNIPCSSSLTEHEIYRVLEVLGS